MDIKLKLKEVGIKIGEFADALKITRPTLNNYIIAFESNEKISNSKYQFIFEQLFNNRIESKEEFEDMVKHFHKLLERDDLLGTLEFDVKKTDLMTKVIQRIKDDLEEEDYDENIYIFINMIIGNYRKERIFKEFSKYFLYLNDVYDISDIKESEKPFLSNCYKLMHKEKIENLETDNIYYEKFLERIKQIKVESDKIAEEKLKEAVKKKLEVKMNERVQELTNMGIDVKDIDFEEILEDIILNKDE
ncbi:MAG: hypothetical protein N4A76_00925 [Firmicutes bacterium]|nr:hypothetical protein [Bacillota bacterium]